MKIEKITIANLKCSACETAIKKTLSGFKGVERVEVNMKENLVTINYTGNLMRKDFTNSLQSIGYPESIQEKQKESHV